MELLQQMMEEHHRLTLKEQTYQNAIAKLPKGTLKYFKNRNTYKYFQDVDGKRFYLSRNDLKLRDELAQKQFLMAETKDIQSELRAIELYLKHHKEESAAKKLLVEREGIASILQELVQPMDVKQKEWAAADYRKNEEYPEGLIHPGPFGKMYRSKTEADIAFLLNKNRIAARYEEMHMINGIEYPIDFTTKHPVTGKTIFWEHFGKMDDSAYAKKIGPKLFDYESAGIFPGINLILTFESARFPINSNQLDEIIRQWYF